MRPKADLGITSVVVLVLYIEMTQLSLFIMLTEIKYFILNNDHA